MPKFKWIKKVLVLGSGAIKIGEAAEFDYSGSQCIKALREEGIEIVLVNPNIATIQTDPRLAGKVYLLPVKPRYVEEIIKREKPDGILLGFGGQTALNCGVQLAKEGILERYGVEVLGAPISAIEATEDRELFKQAMIRAGIPVLKSKSVTSVKEALKAADEIGYPVILRVAYTLGGKGSSVAYNADELKRLAAKALAQSMISQVLVEEYVGKWKEIEYEVMRDQANNCITVCNMENFDPMGIHTGDSIVVAPSQTLTNREYHLLRSASIKVIQSLGIVGECNIQWALNPCSEEFRVIEVNARMSRSSALASKATGYPLAYIAAKLAIGYLLPELINKVTGITTACFEPSLDYIVVKIPRWDFQKFRNVDRRLGSQMKSVGEVMAIGRCFEEALQKAVRMLDIGKAGLVGNGEDESESVQLLKKALAEPTDERLFKIVKAIKAGIPIKEIYRLSGIDPWFLYKIKNIIEMEGKLKSLDINSSEAPQVIREAKRLGFSDKQIAGYISVDELTIREWRKRKGITPVVKQIDTLAAEWPAKTNYLYLTYGGSENDIDFKSKGSKVVVLGAGVFRIGSSVEFDWCAVNTVWALKKYGVDEVVVINYNPETVSTDYDICDKLYFEELTLERVLDICEKENPLGVVVSVGGQMPNNIALKLTKLGVRLLGTPAESIDRAEDRSKFSRLLEELGIPQPEWSELTALEGALKFADEIGYPVLVRPSYVLSGSGMKIAYSRKELKNYLELAAKVSPEHPVVISKFIKDAREVDVDGVSDGEEVFIGAIIEHVENAGVHSGDSIMCIPPQTIPKDVLQKIEDYTERIAKSLKIRGPFNIQYISKNGEVYVIECNLRASRSMPFVSKTIGINLMELSTLAMLGRKFKESGICRQEKISHVGVKVPQFSFMRLNGADLLLGVEMQSTGEVACLGENFFDALVKALQSAEFNIPKSGGSILLHVADETKGKEMLPLLFDFWRMGFKIYTNKLLAETMTSKGVNNIVVFHNVNEMDKNPNPIQLSSQRKIDLIISIPCENPRDFDDGYIVRRVAAEFNIPVVTTAELAYSLVKALKYLKKKKPTLHSLQEYHSQGSCQT